MIAGLCIVLFLSHRRIWVRVISRSDGEGSQILISGVSNKNKPAFERLFQELVDVVDRDAATLYDNKSP
jgi:cytochrome c biogenesis protein